MIDVTKPLVTRKGKSVVVLTTEGPDKDFPVVGHMVGSSAVRMWSQEGVFKGKNREFDLENAKPCSPFTTEVTDGHGRVILRLLVVPEDNKVIVEKADCVLERDGVNLLEKPVVTPFKPNPSNHTRGAYNKDEARPAGGLATAFYNSLNSGNSMEIQEG